MASEGQYDPYARGGGGRAGFGPNILDLIRYTAAALGVVMIILGMFFALRVFGTVMDIIDSPESFVANLDSWSNAEPEEETVPVPPPAPAAAPASDVADADATEANPTEAADAAPPPPRNTPRVVPTIPQSQPMATEFDKNFGEFLDLVREGRMGRVAGAVIIVLLLSLLSKIPLAFMRIGVQLLSASGGFKRS